MSMKKGRNEKERRKRVSKNNSSQAGVPPLSPFANEQVLRDIQRLIGDRVFESMDEANAFFRTLHGPGLREALKDAPARFPQDEAQELIYEAMEIADPAVALSLARQALAKDPDCVDALTILAIQTAESEEARLAALEHAVSTGERVLGPECFKKNRGHFWGLLETRAYMRARNELADLLLRMGRENEAIAHFEALLDLNPSDNLGVRHPLLGRYLAKDDLKRARRLLRKYKESSSAVFYWGRTLERFLSGDLRGAEEALRDARARNRFVEVYLTGLKRAPSLLPRHYIDGSDDEALVCLDAIGEAWDKHPEALAWLQAITLRRKAS